MKKIILLGFVLMIAVSVKAQEKFEEGKISMTQTITTDNEEMQAMLEQVMGGSTMESVTYIKGQKTRAEVSNPSSGDIIMITDMSENKMLMLMDSPMMGKKYTMTDLDSEEVKKASENVTVTEGTETKTILGYECKQYMVTVDQAGVKMEMEMYVTNKIVPVMTQQTAMLGDKLKGFPMYMVMNMNQQGMAMTITTEVKELNKEAIADAKFSLTPLEGYSKM